MFTYNDLQVWSERTKIPLKNVCQQLDYTPSGLRRAFEKKTLPQMVILKLCEIVGISPNHFFGVADNAQFTSFLNGNVNNIAANNTTSNDYLIAQLTEKDRQIQQLLNLLNKTQK